MEQFIGLYVNPIKLMTAGQHWKTTIFSRDVLETFSNLKLFFWLVDSKGTSQDWVDVKKMKAPPNLIFKMGRYISIPHKNHKRYNMFGRGSNLELLINLNYLIGLPRPAGYFLPRQLGIMWLCMSKIWFGNVLILCDILDHLITWISSRNMFSSIYRIQNNCSIALPCL